MTSHFAGRNRMDHTRLFSPDKSNSYFLSASRWFPNKLKPYLYAPQYAHLFC